MQQIRTLVVRMTTENRGWGYTRVRGALANLGRSVARGTVANILNQHGIEPVPERGKKTTWREFLQARWEVLAATDFFTVEVWTRSAAEFVDSLDEKCYPCAWHKVLPMSRSARREAATRGKKRAAQPAA